MTTLTSLTYHQHIDLAIQLSVARRMFFGIQGDIFKYYPQKVWRNLPVIDDEILELMNLLDEQLHREQHKNLSLKARCIYFNGFGDKIFHQLGISFSSVIDDTLILTRKKPRFTEQQYKEVITRIEQLTAFFSTCETTLSKIYFHIPEIGEQARNILNLIHKFREKLESSLRREHGEDHSMFKLNIDIPASATYLVNTTPQKDLIAKYIYALKADDNQMLCELDDTPRDIIATRSNQTPIESNRVA